MTKTIRTKKTRQSVMAAPVLPSGGQRVGVVCGPGEWAQDNAGTVLCIVEDRWGKHAVVLMDDGRTETCMGLTTVGIGWHAI